MNTFLTHAYKALFAASGNWGEMEGIKCHVRQQSLADVFSVSSVTGQRKAIQGRSGELRP